MEDEVFWYFTVLTLEMLLCSSKDSRAVQRTGDVNTFITITIFIIQLYFK